MEEKKTPKTPAWGTPGKPAESKTPPAAASTPSASPAGPAENKFTQWHDVVSGDTLWKIAKKYYGDGSLYMEIFKANQDVLTDPDKIKVGQKLRIP
jgi:nucleoid-associated protein YgaU